MNSLSSAAADVGLRLLGGRGTSVAGAVWGAGGAACVADPAMGEVDDQLEVHPLEVVVETVAVAEPVAHGRCGRRGSDHNVTVPFAGYGESGMERNQSLPGFDAATGPGTAWIQL